MEWCAPVRWVMAKGAIPIPGTTSLEHVASNAGACNVSLTEADMAEVEAAAAEHKGERGNADYMSKSYHAQD